VSPSTARLAWPLAISLALHLGVGWLLSTGSAQLPRKVKAIALTVSLSSKQGADPAPISSPAPVLPTPPDSPAAVSATEASGTVTQKPRFLVDPDLSVLERIPVPLSGSLSIRLHVSSLGTVERVTVIKSDPVPKELLDGLLSRFEHARLSPALAGSEAVASTLDVVIVFEAGAIPLPGNQ